MRNTTARLLAVAALLLGSVALLADEQSEQSKPTSANVFGLFANRFLNSPPTKANIDQGMWPLQKVPGELWRMSDLSGTVEVSVNPNSGWFSVTYDANVRVSLGDAALAALIARAESVEFGRTAEELVITINTRSLSDGERKGTRTELLTIGLDGGVLREAEVISIWK
jgi:hypothetical protein